LLGLTDQPASGGLVRQIGSYTRGSERYALELSRHMTIKDVARHLGVNLGYDQEYPEKESGAPVLSAQAGKAQTDRR